LTALPLLRAQPLRASVHLLCFSSRREPCLQEILPCSRSSFPTWRRRLGEGRSSPLPATSASSTPGMPRPPLVFPCAVRDGAPQTLTKLSVFESDSSYNIVSYLLTWISFARRRIIGCTCVLPCPMLGPPLICPLKRLSILLLSFRIGIHHDL